MNNELEIEDQIEEVEEQTAPVADAAFDLAEFRRDQDTRFNTLAAELRETRSRNDELTNRLMERNAPAETVPEPVSDWLAEVESKGPDAFNGRFATPAQVREEVTRAVHAVKNTSAQEQLKADFPDLFIEGSDFRNLTDQLLQGKYAAFAANPATKFDALKIAAAEAKDQMENRKNTRTARAGAAGAYRPMNGSSGTSPGSKAVALTNDQRQWARELNVPEKDYLASLNSIADGDRR